MDIGKISYWSRRIHRISLWFVTISGLVQMVTGLAQKYPQIFVFPDFTMVITVHTLNSVIFTIFFLISIFTGLIMYFTPWLIKKARKNNP